MLGRPRTFDLDTALDQAMRLFWRYGYDGTTLSQLTEAMGITRPSLYAAFGNKESLFEKVLDRYASGPAAYMTEAMAAPTTREVAENLLRGAADAACNPDHPGGCLVVTSALSCGAGGQSIQALLSRARESSRQALKLRLEQGGDDGELPPNMDPDSLARQIMALLHGIVVQALDGASNLCLQTLVDDAIRTWFGDLAKTNTGSVSTA